MTQIARALCISRKDIESYYGKPPLITWGLLFPAVLILAAYVRSPSGYLVVAPGIMGMTLLFGNTSMAAIVTTFEKRSGTVRRLLLAPVTHRTIMVGKAASAGLYGTATCLVLTAGLHLLAGMHLDYPLFFIAGLLLGATTFSLLGLAVAVSVREVFEAMTLLNFFRFPVLFISGVFMPLEKLPAWIKPVAALSPLTHVVELMRFGVSGQCGLASPWVAMMAATVFLATSYLIAGAAFRRGLSR